MNKKPKRKYTKRKYTKRKYTKRKYTKRKYTKRKYTKRKNIINNLPNAKGVPLFSSQLINKSNNIITYKDKDKDKFLNDSIVPDLRNFLR